AKRNSRPRARVAARGRQADMARAVILARRRPQAHIAIHGLGPHGSHDPRSQPVPARRDAHGRPRGPGQGLARVRGPGRRPADRWRANALPLARDHLQGYRGNQRMIKAMTRSMCHAGFDRRDLEMLRSLFRMNLNDRFLGSSLGMIWAVLSPLMLMGIFCFVFTYVFPGRLPGKDGAMPFLIWLISGYGPWLAISEGLSSATGAVVSNAGVVKNIAFKSEIVPLVGTLMGLCPLAVAIVVILLLQVGSGEAPRWTLALLPAVVVLHLVFVAGIGLFLAALNVFVRDTALVLPNVLTIVLFASPIFYTISAYPPAVQTLLVFSPFYVITELYRITIVEGTLPPPWMVAYIALAGGLSFTCGLWWFRRLKSFFD